MPLLQDVNQVAITVADLDRAVAFYRDVLEVPFLFDVPGMPMAFFQCGSVRLYLDASGEQASTPILYFRVASVPEAYEDLRAKGVELVGEPHVVNRTATSELWMAFFRDSEGHLMAITADVAVDVDADVDVNGG